MDKKVRFVKSRATKIVLGTMGISVVAIMMAVLPAAASGNPSEVITPEELRDLQLKGIDFILWDARNKESYQASHIQGATLPLPDAFYTKNELYAKSLSPDKPDPVVALEEEVRGIDRAKPIVTYCNRNCPASHTLLVQLKDLGFTNVRSMEAGIQVWEEKGYPVVLGDPKLRSDSL